MASTTRSRREARGTPGLMCSMDQVLDRDDRSYQPVGLDVVGEEAGQERYARREEDLDRDPVGGPLVAGWRHNLTACSQRWNLHFVAHGNWIKVFVPGHHSHRLGRDETYKFPAATKNADAVGYMSHHEPHDVNHLIVGDLGSEEILLIAMDSGNVAAYYTSRIWDAICRAEEGTKDGPGAVCEPFFTYWVRFSSWGLAIHKEARMIAVSSNNPYTVAPQRSRASVTLFAFALVNPAQPDQLAPGEDPDRAEWRTGWVDDPTPAAPDRSRNWVRTLLCHLHNIPNISFINTNEDREGRFLLTASISGEAILWDIWRSERVIERDFSRVPGSWKNPDVMAARREHEGWNIIALDPQSFQAVRTFEQFYGRCGLKMLLRGTVDIGESLLNLPGQQLETSSDSDLEETETQIPSNASRLGDRHGVSRMADQPDADDVALLMQSWQDLYGEEGWVSGEGSISEADPYDSDDYTMPDSPLRTSPDAEGEPQGLDETETGRDLPSPISNTFSTNDPPQRSTMTCTHFPHITSPFHTHYPPSFPAIHLSARDLHLFEAGTSKEPSVVCTNLLQYPVRNPNRDPKALDRLIMSQSIPELGVVVVATQAGRAAVCTLTTAGPGGPYSIRIDWILPFPSQEARFTRQNPSLLGIATSPVPDHQQSHRDSSSPPTSESESGDSPDEPHQPQIWLRDRVDKSGIPISFDPHIIRSSETLKTQNPSSNIPPRKSQNRKSTKRELLTSPPLSQTSPNSSRTTSLTADMPLNDHPRAWHGVEYSRRFRLMLTYTNHTVLTYELSRPRPWARDEAGQR